MITIAVVRDQFGKIEVAEIRKPLLHVLSNRFAWMDLPNIGRACMPVAPWTNVIVPKPCI